MVDISSVSLNTPLLYEDDGQMKLISKGNVTSRDDVTVRDLYRFAMIEVDDDPKL